VVAERFWKMVVQFRVEPEAGMGGFHSHMLTRA
jgi:hypothetical protein